MTEDSTVVDRAEHGSRLRRGEIPAPNDLQVIKTDLQDDNRKHPVHDESGAPTLGCDHVVDQGGRQSDFAGMHGPLSIHLKRGRVNLEQLSPDEWIVSFQPALEGDKTIRVFTQRDGVPLGGLRPVLSWARTHI